MVEVFEKLFSLTIHLLVLLIKTGISTNVEDSNGSPSTINYAPRPLSSPYEKYLNNCASKLYPLCGDEIFYTVFSGNQTTGTECCYNLINEVGERCHQDLTRYILSLEDYKHNKSSFWQRSKKVWDDCASILLNISPVESVYPTVFNFD
ncbi:prolamin-like protein [Medicago truncatula]|uniref:Prolamin-like protein n=1 Tax=Medicago truncatula TaxID=3880 RepID=G7LF24_MEDTR|nr:prolamin-like protein [Medicago truncatula]